MWAARSTGAAQAPRGAAGWRVCIVTAAGLLPGRSHADVTRAAVEGGADAVQLRAPEVPADQLPALARLLTEICRPEGVRLLVNDDVGAAVLGGADGAHVGQSDDPQRARDMLGPEKLLGISVSSPAEARAAVAAGANYVGVTVWATATKPEASPVGIEGLRAIAEACAVPIIAIGGISPERVPQVLAAGATAVAAVSWVAASADPVGATRALVHAVEEHAERNPNESDI